MSVATEAHSFYGLSKKLVNSQPKYKKFLIIASFAFLAYKISKKLTRKHSSIIQNPNTKLFYKKLKVLLKIMFSRLMSKQAGLLAIHSLILISRSLLSVYVAKLDGSLVKNIIEKNFTQFGLNLAKWLLVALPATTCNSLIKYLESQLDLELKSTLVNKSLQLYFNNRVYYSISLKPEKPQIEQILTEEIEKLTGLLVHLYSNLAKPIFDVALMAISLIPLARKQGFNCTIPMLIGILVVSATGWLIRTISPRFGKLTAEKAKRKRYIKFLYSRVQENSEEIAFYGGEKIEKNLINNAFNAFISTSKALSKQEFWFLIVEQFFMKYIWSAAGLSMLSISILLSDKSINGVLVKNMDQMSNRIEFFTTAKYLMINAADAVQRIMNSFTKISEFSRLTIRVHDMLETFSIIGSENKVISVVHESIHQRNITFNNVRMVTPNKDVIVPCLSLDIKAGMNLLITGPKGCGKSSLFRLICGLWRHECGKIWRPAVNEMFYVPQKPYLPIGTLRDQIIYPDSHGDMQANSMTDTDLMKILEIVNLTGLVMREKYLDTVKDWKDVLSGDEKQLMNLSRLFYHKPKFAFLDESTSNVSEDVEAKIYKTAKNEFNITLLTIGRRATLWQHHNFNLHFDGLGNWKLEELA